MAERARPLSPFLHYRWQYTNTLSILHRITGVLLSLGFLTGRDVPAGAGDEVPVAERREV